MAENKDGIDLEGWDLHRAARENRGGIARALIARGDDVDARDEDGDTPLHGAAWYNFLDVATPADRQWRRCRCEDRRRQDTPALGSLEQIPRHGTPADRAWCKYRRDRPWLDGKPVSH